MKKKIPIIILSAITAFIFIFEILIPILMPLEASESSEALIIDGTDFSLFSKLGNLFVSDLERTLSIAFYIFMIIALWLVYFTTRAIIKRIKQYIEKKKEKKQ